MKKLLIILAAGLFALTACQKQTPQLTIYTVDQVYAQGDSLVGDTIWVEGTCMHLCKHGGKKAFLRSSEEGEFIRANATDFECFAGECINNTLRVKGILRAMEVPAEQPKTEATSGATQATQSEHQHSAGEACDVCASVRKYYVDAVSYEILTD